MQTSTSRFIKRNANRRALTRSSALRLPVLAPVLLAAITVGNAYAATYAYVPNQGNGTASVIDTSSQTQTSLIAGMGTDYSAAVAPNGSIAYVADFTGNRIFPINTTTNIAGTAITVGTSPVNVTFSSDSATAYVSNYNANSISVVNVAGGTVTTTVAAVCPAGAANPIQSIFNGAKLLIVCNGATSKVISMDTSAGNALTTLATVGNTAYNIAISTASGFGYVSNYGGGNVSKFDLNTGVTTTYTSTGVNSPLGLAVTPDGSKIFVGDYGGNNLIVMSPNGAISTTLNLGAHIAGIGMSSTGSVLYVPLRGLAAGIKVINTSTNTVTGTIANPGADAEVIWGNFLGNVAAPSAPGGPTSIPTLSEWGLITLAALLAMLGLRHVRAKDLLRV
jgi:DNA-binding beta-propeller fold protein YncE